VCRGEGTNSEASYEKSGGEESYLMEEHLVW
jgi:hypothetical protein